MSTTRLRDNLVIEFKRFASKHGIIDRDPRDVAEEMRYDPEFDAEPTPEEVEAYAEDFEVEDDFVEY